MRRVSNPFASIPRAVLATSLAAAVSLTAGIGHTQSAESPSSTHLSGRSSVASHKTAVVDTWGDNSAGELGNATLTQSLVPVPANTSAAGTASVTAIAAGGRHDLALLSNGRVLAWGDDTFGQLGNGKAGVNHDAEAAGFVKHLSAVVAVAAGGEHSLALLSNGTVEAWGDNHDGQLGDGTKTDSDVPVLVKGLSAVTAISTGDQFSLALLSSGTVEAWGENELGELGDGTLKNSAVPVAVSGLSGVSAISGGGQHALALLDKGTAVSWGDNEFDQLGDGKDGSTQQTLSKIPVAVDGLSGAVAVTAGYLHSLALLSNGTVMAWGDNGFFQLARSQDGGLLGASDVPLAVPGISHATAIAAGAMYSLALSNTGTVAAWGDNAFGQLGNSSTATESTVVNVKGLKGVTAIAAGGAQGLALVTPQAAGQASLAEASGPPSSPWRVLPTKKPPAGLSSVGLDAVSASSPTDAWAVGSTGSEQPTGEPAGEHWNGKSWTIATLAPGPDSPSILSGVDDLGPTNAWAVGSSGGVGSERTLIEHWDGTSWTVVPSPDPETGPGEFDELRAISGTSPDDLWAVGTFSIVQDDLSEAAVLLLHWNGTTWTFFAPPSASSQFGEAVTVVSPDDAWAVGDELGGTVSLHFNGTSWKSVATPILIVNDSVNDLTGITNAGADDIWASGFLANGGTNFRTPYLLHWTGTAWKLVKVPNAGSEGTQLTGVTLLSANDVWVTGVTEETDGAAIAFSEQFNGTSWSIVPGLEPGQLASLPVNTFQAIAAAGPSTLFAVGGQDTPPGGGSVLVEEDTTAG